jgi:hypothetical protein
MSTLDWMSLTHLTPRLLRKKLLLLILLALQLLDALVVVVHGHAQHLLGPFLPYDEVVQMLLEHLGRDLGCSHAAGAAQRASSWFSSLIYACVALSGEV